MAQHNKLVQWRKKTHIQQQHQQHSAITSTSLKLPAMLTSQHFFRLWLCVALYACVGVGARAIGDFLQFPFYCFSLFSRKFVGFLANVSLSASPSTTRTWVTILRIHSAIPFHFYFIERIFPSFVNRWICDVSMWLDWLPACEFHY